VSEFRIHGIIDAQNRQFLKALAESKAALAAAGGQHRAVAKDAREHAIAERQLGRALQDQRRQLAALTGQYVNLRRALLTTAVRTSILGFNALAASISAVVNTLVELTASLGYASAGLVTFGAAGLGAAVQGALTLKLALKDVGKAIFAVGTAQQNAYDKLTKPAREFVDRLKGMREQFDMLKLTAQKGLFPGLERGLAKASKAFEPLRDVIWDTARVLGYLGERLGILVGKHAKDLHTIGEKNARVLQRLGDVALNLGEGLIEVYKAAIPLIDHMTTGLVKWSEKMRDASQSAQGRKGLVEFFKEVRRQTDDWVRILGAAGGTLGNVLKAAAGPAHSLNLSMAGVLEKWEKWTGSAAGQTRMTGFFKNNLPVAKEMAKFVGSIADMWIRLTEQGNKHAVRFWRGLRTQLVPTLEHILTTIDGQLFERIMDFGSLFLQVTNQIVTGMQGLMPIVQAVGSAFHGIASGFTSMISFLPGVTKLLGVVALVAGWRKLSDVIRLAVLQLRTYVGLSRELAPGAFRQGYREIFQRGGRNNQEGFAGGSGVVAPVTRGGGGGGGGLASGQLRREFAAAILDAQGTNKLREQIGGLGMRVPESMQPGRRGIYGNIVHADTMGTGVNRVFRRGAGNQLVFPNGALGGSHGFDTRRVYQGTATMEVGGKSVQQDITRRLSPKTVGQLAEQARREGASRARNFSFDDYIRRELERRVVASHPAVQSASFTQPGVIGGLLSRGDLRRGRDIHTGRIESTGIGASQPGRRSGREIREAMHFDRTGEFGLRGRSGRALEGVVAGTKAAIPKLAGVIKGAGITALATSVFAGVISGLASESKTLGGRVKDAVSGATFGLTESNAEGQNKLALKLARQLRAGRYTGANDDLLRIGGRTTSVNQNAVGKARLGIGDLIKPGSAAGVKAITDDLKALEKQGKLTADQVKALREVAKGAGAALDAAGGNVQAFRAGLDFGLKPVRVIETISGAVDTAAEKFAGLKDAWMDLDRQGGKSTKSIRTSLRLAGEEVQASLGKKSQLGRMAMAKNFRLAAQAVKESMDKGVISVKDGTALMNKYLVSAVVQTSGGMWTRTEAQNYLNGKDITGKSKQAADAGSGYDPSQRFPDSKKKGAASGYIKGPGGGRDAIHAVVGDDEAVVNSHQQKILNVGLQAIGIRGGMPQLMRNVKGYHGVGDNVAQTAGLPGFAKGGGNPLPSHSAGVVRLGQVLRKMGFAVGENRALGDNPAAGAHAAGGWHYKQGNSGAIDVNADTMPGGEKANIDRLIPWLRKGGWHYLWQVADHFDHLHVDNAAGGGGGALGALAGKLFKAAKVKKPNVGGLGKPGIDTLHKLATARTKEAARFLNETMSAAGGGVVQGGGGITSAGGNYNKAELAALWKQVNGNLGDPNLMAAIALAESGGRSSIVNSIGAGGLWQIYPPEPGYLDPVTNARIAGRKLKSQGLGAWEAYTKGMHVKFLASGGGNPQPPSFNVPAPKVSTGDATTPADRKAAKKKAAAKKRNRRPVGHLLRPSLKGIRPRKHNPKAIKVSPKLKQIAKVVRGIDLSALPTSEPWDTKVGDLQNTLGAIAGRHDLTDESPTVQLYDGDPNFGGLPDLTSYLNATPSALHGAKNINDFFGRYGNGLEVPNQVGDLDTGSGFRIQGDLVRGIPERVRELRELLVAHTGSPTGQVTMDSNGLAGSFDSILGTLTTERAFIGGNFIPAYARKGDVLKKKMRELHRTWSHIHAERVDDAQTRDKLRRANGLTWQQRRSINSQKIDRLEKYLQDVRELGADHTLDDATKKERVKATAAIRDLKDENESLEKKKPAAHPKKPVRRRGESAKAYANRIDDWRDANRSRDRKVASLNRSIADKDADLNFITNSTSRWQTNGGIAGEVQDGLDTVNDGMKALGQQLKDLNSAVIPQELTDIGQLVREMNEWAGTKVPIPALDLGSRDTSALDEIAKQQRDDALRALALSGEQFKVFQGFAPLAAQRLVGAFAHGGVVPETGLALVHKNERILPDPDGAFRTNQNARVAVGGATNVSLTLAGELGPLMKLIDARVDDRAARVVSEQLGKRSRLIASAPGRSR
jgi:hypothetical protein